MLANMFVDVYFNLKATTQTRELAHMTAEVFIVTCLSVSVGALLAK